MDTPIIAANRYLYPASIMPYGACMVAEAAAAAGHQVRFLDLTFQCDPLGAVASTLRDFPAEVVGLSVRNLDNNDMQSPVEFVSDLTELSQTVRGLSDAPVILGGPAVAVMPETLLRRTGALAAVLGDGERVFPALQATLGNGGDFSRVPQLAWLEDDRRGKQMPRWPRPSILPAVPCGQGTWHTSTWVSASIRAPSWTRLPGGRGLQRFWGRPADAGLLLYAGARLPLDPGTCTPGRGG